MAKRHNQGKEVGKGELQCRIFVGNLASEKTSEDEIIGIFSRYS